MRRTLITAAATLVVALAAGEATAATHTITLDATAIDYPQFYLHETGQYLSTSSTHSLTLAEGTYRLGHSPAHAGSISFQVDSNGEVQYASAYEMFLDGAGTSTITFVGVDTTVDVSDLEYGTVSIKLSGIGELSKTASQTVRLLPFLRNDIAIANGGGGVWFFFVDVDGHVDYTDAWEPFIDGEGTSSITLVGYDMTFVASANLTYVASNRVGLGGIGDLPRDGTPLERRLMPHAAYAVSVGSGNAAHEQFAIGLDGKIGDLTDAPWFSGTGTSTLTVVGCALTVDARGLSASTFGIGAAGAPGSVSFPTSSVATVRLLPSKGSASYGILVDGDVHLFEVTDSCTFDYATAEEDFLAGRGTSALLVGVSFETTVLQPINADGSSIFKAGRTIPVKVDVRDHEDAPVSDEALQLRVYQTSNTISGTVEEVDPVASGNANSGDLFRYDTDGGYYVFNLSTKGFSAGTYRLEFAIDGVVWGDVQISLRN
jgi:hypothetical protein